MPLAGRLSALCTGPKGLRWALLARRLRSRPPPGGAALAVGGQGGACSSVRSSAPGARLAGGAEWPWNFAEFLERKGREAGLGCRRAPCGRRSARREMAPGAPVREVRNVSAAQPRVSCRVPLIELVGSATIMAESAFVSGKPFVFGTGELLVIVMNGRVVEASQAGVMLNGVVFFCLSETQI